MFLFARVQCKKAFSMRFQAEQLVTSPGVPQSLELGRIGYFESSQTLRCDVRADILLNRTNDSSQRIVCDRNASGTGENGNNGDKPAPWMFVSPAFQLVEYRNCKSR